MWSFSHPVVSGSKENKDFYKWTPGGSYRLETINDAAAARFDVDGECYVTFEKAE